MQQRGTAGQKTVPAAAQRLFFALWPEEAVREGIAAAAAALRRQRAPQGRWVGRDRYHLTLHFLGDVDAEVASAAVRAAASLQADAFELVLDVAGSFRSRSMPWWLGSALPPPRLHALWSALGGSLSREGVRADCDRALVPHVTVLRDARRALPSTPVAPVRWPVREFVLVHSVSGPGPAYHLLGRWPLAPSQDASGARP